MLFEGRIVVNESAPLELALYHAAFVQELEIVLCELESAGSFGLSSESARKESAQEQQTKDTKSR